MHGHSYRLEVAIDGTIRDDGPSAGMVIDFDEIEKLVKASVIDRLDHTSLNDVMENPTSENLVVWIWGQLDAALSGLSELVLWETATACAVLRRDDL